MNKKGFTVVELIVSFALATTVAIFLFQLVVVLNNLYNNSGLKTELLNKQSLISNQINTTFSEKEINVVTKCGAYCVNFIYTDGTSDKLAINHEENKIEFGSYSTILPGENSYFGNSKIDVVYVAAFHPDHNNAILNISIPIYNDSLKDENFGINIAYQFNHNYSNIDSVRFDSDENDYGYIQVIGSDDIVLSATQTYTDLGYRVFDSNGDEISGAEVNVTDPFTSLTAPYPAGDYEIKYDLVYNGTVVYSTTRTVMVIS